MGLSRYVCRMHNETSEALSKGVGRLKDSGWTLGRSRDIPDTVEYLYLGAPCSIHCSYNIVLYSLSRQEDFVYIHGLRFSKVGIRIIARE